MMPTAQSVHIQNVKNIIFLKVSLAAFIHKEKPRMYVSYCPALDLYSQGTTKIEAEKNIIEATQLLIESCIEDDTLKEVLEECGFSPINRQSSKKRTPKKYRLPPAFETAQPITIPSEFPMLAYG